MFVTFFSFLFSLSFLFLSTAPAIINFRITQSQFYKRHNNHKISLHKNKNSFDKTQESQDVLHNNHEILFHKNTQESQDLNFTIIRRVHQPNFLVALLLEGRAPVFLWEAAPSACSVAVVARPPLRRREASLHRWVACWPAS